VPCHAVFARQSRGGGKAGDLQWVCAIDVLWELAHLVNMLLENGMDDATQIKDK
jgi:hypothetical protein